MKRFFCLRCLLPVLMVAICIVAVSTFGSHTAVATQGSPENDEPTISGGTLQDYRDQLELINQRLEALEENIAAQNTLIAGLESEIAAIDSQLILITEKLTAANQAIETTEQIIYELEQQIKDAENRLELRLAYLEQRVVDLYIYGEPTVMDVIFHSSSFEDFITLFDMMEIIVSNDKNLAEQIEAERDAIAADKAETELQLEDLVVLQQEYYNASSDLKRLEAEKYAAINEANMTLAEYEDFYASEMAMAEAATERIRALLASSDSTLSYGGSMIWPLPSPWGKNWITSVYGWREHPVYGGNRFHSGIDIGADGGTNIYAAAMGKVILKEYYGGYGNCIMIDHGSGVVSLYAHMSAYGSFNVGDYVVAGDVIGYVGTTGTSSGNHLHFEVRLNGNHVDPMGYLQ